MTDILTEIAAYKRDFVARAMASRPLAEVRAAAADEPEPRDFGGALGLEGISLIAEIKRASPSKGLIRADFDPEAIARVYADSGARALSVLTDEAYFQGRDAYLQLARQVSGLPVLRKDFTVDPYQIYESRLIGADAVLLIVALMDGGQLEDFLGLARELGLAVLVEVHDTAEMVRAASAGAPIVGINNRDLRTFETRLETTLALLPDRPAGSTVVSESGIGTREDVELLEASGIDAILVGESLMRESDIGAKVRQLLGATSDCEHDR